MKKLVILAPLLLLFIVESCVPSKPKDEAREVFPAERVIKKLEANRRKVKTFEGKGVVKIQSPEMSAKSNFEVTLKKPDSVKISMYGPFGVDLAHALVTKDDFVFYYALKNKVYRGAVKDEVLQRVFKIDLNFDDIMDAFAGAVNLTGKLRSVPDKYESADNSFVLTYIDSSANKRSVYKVNEENLAITEYILSALDGDIIFEGDYSRFKMMDDVAVPFNITVENSDSGRKLDIEYRDIKVNGDVDNLQVRYPNDVEIIEW